MKKYLLVLLSFLGIAFSFQACGNDNDDNSDEPTLPTLSYKPAELFNFDSYITGGSTTNNNGHITSTPGIIVQPVWEIPGSNTIVLNLGARFVLNENTTSNGVKVFLKPTINSEKIGNDWTITKITFNYQGNSYENTLSFDYGTNEQSRTLSAEMSYILSNTLTNQTISDKADIYLKVLRESN